MGKVAIKATLLWGKIWHNSIRYRHQRLIFRSIGAKLIVRNTGTQVASSENAKFPPDVLLWRNKVNWDHLSSKNAFNFLVFANKKRHHICMLHCELLSIVDNMPQMLSQTCPRWCPRHAQEMSQKRPRWCPSHVPDMLQAEFYDEASCCNIFF